MTQDTRLLPETIHLPLEGGLVEIKPAFPARFIIPPDFGQVAYHSVQPNVLIASARAEGTAYIGACIGTDPEVWCRVTTDPEPSPTPTPDLPPLRTRLWEYAKDISPIVIVALLAIAAWLAPGPKPNPVDPVIPPAPKPVEPPAPIKKDGLHVLIIYESADGPKLTAKQSNELYGQSLKDFLDAKCAVEADGKTKAWRILDKDTPMQSAPEYWRDAMANYKDGTLPRIVVSNGKTGTVAALPDGGIQEFIARYAQ